MENLQLKAEALSDLNLPLLVAMGHLELLSLKIPWRNLSRRPTEIRLKGLYILVVPKNEMERNESEQRTNKMRKVQMKVEEMKRILIENIELNETKDESLFEKLSKQILQNLRIEIEDFHLSYQTESTSKLGHPFAFGLTFQFIQISGEKFVEKLLPSKSNDKDKEKEKEKEKSSIIYFLREIRCLSIYWNRMFQSKRDQSHTEILNRLKRQTGETKDKTMNFIHYPRDLQMDFRLIYHRPEEKFHRSSFEIDFNLDEIFLQLNAKQFSDLLDFIKFQNYSQLYERCRLYRDLYFKSLKHRDELTKEDEDNLQMLEKKLDTFNLSYIQFCVQTEIDDENGESSQQSSSMKMSSSTSRWNFWKKTKHRSFDEYHQMAMQISQMYSNDSMKLYFEDLPNLDIRLKAKQINLYLVEPQPNSIDFGNEFICYVRVNQSNIDVSKRSISSNTLLKMSFGQIVLFDYENGEPKTILVQSDVETNEENPSTDLEFELYPTNSIRSDYRFHWRIQPIKILYSFKLFNRIVENFEKTIDNDTEWNSFKIEEHSSEQRHVDLLHRKIFDLEILFRRIRLRFPSSLNADKSMEIVLSELHLRTQFDDDNSSKSKQIDEEFYAKYLFTWNRFNVRWISSTRNRIDKIIRGNNSMSILFFQCLYTNDLNLLDWILFVEMKFDRMNSISKEILSKVKNHFATIPNLSSTINEILSRINRFFWIFPRQTSMKIFSSWTHFPLEFIEFDQQFRYHFDFQLFLHKNRENLQQINFLLKNLSIHHRSMELFDPRTSNWFYLSEKES